jgi:predicted DNA-binding transcriptional regulator YafY
MNRIDRLVAILIHLQSKKVVTAREIADRFEISQRTVYRDIRALEEAGVPLGSEAGVGYFIHHGYHIPPVMFTRDEAAAMLTAEKMMEKLTDNSMVNQYSSAMFKIKSVLRSAEKEYLEKLDAHIYVLQPPSFTQNLYPGNYLSLVQQALANKNILEIEYYSASDKNFTKRNVEPLGLCFYGNRWHLIAFCMLRDDYRDFRIDRIRKMNSSDIYFTRNHISIKEYFSSLDRNKNLKSVVIKFSTETAKELYEQKFYYGFIGESKVGKFVEMTFLVDSYEWIAYWLLVLGNKAAVKEPAGLRDFIQQKVELLSKYYLTGISQ